MTFIRFYSGLQWPRRSMSTGLGSRFQVEIESRGGRAGEQNILNLRRLYNTLAQSCEMWSLLRSAAASSSATFVGYLGGVHTVTTQFSRRESVGTEAILQCVLSVL